MQIKEILTREEIAQTIDVLSQNYHNLNRETCIEDITKAFQQNYKMAAAFAENGSCIGIVGIRLTKKLQHGDVIEIEDFAIDFKKYGMGVGEKLIDWVETQATILGCKNIIASLETKSSELQRIFSMRGFTLNRFWFQKK